MTVEEFVDINHRLIVTNPSLTVKDCACGCLESKVTNCDRKYDLADVVRSATVDITFEIRDYMDFVLQKRKRYSQMSWVSSDDTYKKGSNYHTDSGGYCLDAFLHFNPGTG